MKPRFQPWQLLLVIPAGWVSGKQQDASGYRGRWRTCGTVSRTRPLPESSERKRETTWKTFVRAHCDVLASVDFTTIGVWTRRGLVTYYLLLFMELATRRVHSAGLTANPNEGWMLQVARNVTDAEERYLSGKRYLLMDGDAKFSEAFRSTLEQGGVEAVRLPPRSPNLKGYVSYCTSLA